MPAALWLGAFTDTLQTDAATISEAIHHISMVFIHPGFVKTVEEFLDARVLLCLRSGDGFVGVGRSWALDLALT